MIIVLSYLFYFFASSISPLQRRWLFAAKNPDSREQTSFGFQIMCILVLGSLFFPFFSSFHVSGNIFILFLLALTCGVFGAGVFITQFTAQKHIDAGITSIVTNIYTPITIILSSLFLHEGLMPIQIVGTFFLLLAIVIISKKHRVGRFSFDTYFLIMLLSGVLLSVLLVAERALQKITGFSAGTMMSWWSQCFFLGVATLVRKSKNTYTKKELLVTGVLRFFQALSYVMLVYIVGNLSLVSSITSFSVVTIFIGGAIFLQERDDMPRKIFGCIIAVIGLLLMK